MSDLIIFISGMAFGFVILPIFNFASEMIGILTETITSKASVYVTKNNIQITKLSAEIESSGGHAIGFDISGGSDFIEDEDDNDYIDTENKCRKIGF